MLRKTMRCMLMLTLALMLSGLPAAFAAQDVTHLVYKVKYSPDHLATPMDWYNSSYFNNPEYKENRFVQYWVETPIAPGGSRDTGFYMVYDEDGLNIFYQSNEQERDTNGVLKNSSIEFFLQPGGNNVPYHQLIIQTNDSPFEYYEWQTENRNNRPLKGNITVINQEIPTGWGTVVKIPWETYYEYAPLNGEDWHFAMIRWSPSNSPTWGGHVHQIGRFNVLDFETPTAAQRTAMQKSIIQKGWAKFQTTAAQLRATWLNGDSDDQRYFNRYIRPLIAKGEAYGSPIPNLDSMSPAEIDTLYRHVDSWFQLRYDAEDARVASIKNALFRENEAPTVTDATYSTLVNMPVAGVIPGTDADGDPLAYSLGAAPAHGTAAVSADGAWTYTPNEDYAGHDQFTAIVSDPAGDTAVSTVDLIVTPGPSTTLTLDPAESNGTNGWYTSDVSVALTTTDDVLGVKRTEYRLDGGDWNVYNGSFVVAAEGIHTLDYRGVDNDDNVERTKSATIQIDKTAPTIEVTLDKTVLSTPNHKMEPIQATIAHSDGTSGIASFALTSITSSEADNAQGDGSTTGDIAEAEYGTPDTAFSLRAERAGGGNGRVYTVTYTVTDQAGLTSTATATVTVPKG